VKQISYSHENTSSVHKTTSMQERNFKLLEFTSPKQSVV